MDTKPHHQMKRSLHEAFGYRGCPLCHLLDKEEYDFMASLQFQTFKEKETRQTLVSANGYCNFHFHQMARMASPMGMAILTKDLIDVEIKDIEMGSFRTTLRIACPVCKFVEELEECHIKEFIGLLPEESFQKGYEATDGLCRIHLTRVINSLQGDMLHQFMLTSHMMHLKLLKIQLETFILKVKSPSRDLKEERDSWWVAIEKMVGKKGLKK